MARLIRLPGLVIGLMLLVVFAAGIVLVVSAVSNDAQKNVSWTQPLPVGAGPVASMSTQGQCQVERNFDCFLLNMNEYEVIARNNLGRSFDMVQKSGDYSVHLRRGYADGMHIVIVVEVDSPKNFNFMALQPRFTDEQGHEFVSQGEGSSPYTKGQTGIVLTYDSGNINLQLKEINLKLEIPAITPYIHSSPAIPGIAATPTPGPTPVPPPNKIEGPFVFRFSLPVIPAQVIEPKQVVKNAGSDITLEKVIVTPLEIRAYIRGVPNNTVPEVSVNGWTSTTEPGAALRSAVKQADGTVEFILAASPPPDKRAGQWTLSLRPSSEQYPYATAQTPPPNQPNATSTPYMPDSEGSLQTTAAPAIPPGTKPPDTLTVFAATVAPLQLTGVPATPLGAELTPFVPPTPLPIFAAFHFSLP